MNAIALDTHQAVQRLTTSGFSAEQAESIVEVLASSELATKQDIKIASSEVRTELYRALLIHGFVVVAAVIGSAIALAGLISST